MGGGEKGADYLGRGGEGLEMGVCLGEECLRRGEASNWKEVKNKGGRGKSWGLEENRTN